MNVCVCVSVKIYQKSYLFPIGIYLIKKSVECIRVVFKY